MKDQIRDMYEQTTMPQETEQRIRAAMAKDIKRAGSTYWKTAATAAAVLLMVLLISPQARASVEGWVVKYFFPGSDLTIYQKTDAQGNVTGIMASVDTEAPAFAQIVDGRLYFLGNGERIDITDEIAEDAPYFYTYVDTYGLTHAMAVGYSGSIGNFGIYEFIWEEADGVRDWITGSGRNFFSSETGTRYSWVDLVWQQLNVPWPMPE